MSDYLRTQRRWLKVERLPGYAPDLNPVEALWGNIKGQEVANLCSADLGEAACAFRRGLERVRKSCRLPMSFLRHAGLSL
jgi:putative transposase